MLRPYGAGPQRASFRQAALKAARAACPRRTRTCAGATLLRPPGTNCSETVRSTPKESRACPIRRRRAILTQAAGGPEASCGVQEPQAYERHSRAQMPARRRSSQLMLCACSCCQRLPPMCPHAHARTRARAHTPARARARNAHAHPRRTRLCARTRAHTRTRTRTRPHAQAHVWTCAHAHVSRRRGLDLRAAGPGPTLDCGPATVTGRSHGQSRRAEGELSSQNTSLWPLLWISTRRSRGSRPRDARNRRSAKLGGVRLV